MRLGLRGLFGMVLLPTALFLSAFAAQGQTSVWIDSDPAMGMLLKDSDDSVAIAYALKSPRLRVEGISITYGNSYMPKSLKVAQDVFTRFASDPKKESLVIHPGATNRKFLGLATDATVALQQTLNKKKIIYVALGPLTNLATLLQTRPALARNIEQVIWVAGRENGSTLKIGPSNPYSFHDSNFEKDPHAAGVVMAAKIPVTLVSRELAQYFLMSREDQKEISESGEAGKWLSSELDHWMTLWKAGWNIEGAPILDVVPLLLVTHPGSFKIEPRFAGLSMDLKNIVSPGEGQVPKFLLVAPKSSVGQDRPVSYVTDIDVTAEENWMRVMTTGPEKTASR